MEEWSGTQEKRNDEADGSREEGDAEGTYDANNDENCYS